MATTIEQDVLGTGSPAQTAPAKPLDLQSIPSDTELLTRFLRDEDELSFAELVGRHAEMVMRVCRRVLRDDQDAEDVFQATFLILATSCRRIRGRHSNSVAAWLHRVAYRAALRTAQSKHRETCALPDELASSDSEHWTVIAEREEQLIVLEELNRLPSIYREAIVLCCLEGDSCKTAAEKVESTPEAMQKRVDRGRQLLRVRLARRGVAASVAILLTSAATCKAATMSSSSLVSLTTDVCSAAVLQADKAIYSTRVGEIARQGANSMNLISLQTVAAVALVIGAPLMLFAAATGPMSDNDRVKSIQIAPQSQVASVTPYLFVGEQGTGEANRDEQLDENLRIIIHRQKDTTLRLYLNATRGYINGRQLSLRSLKSVVKQMDVQDAVIRAEAEVAHAQVVAWQEAVQAAGIQQIRLTKPAKEEGPQSAIVRVLARQKSESLSVYLKGSRGTYVNGTQVTNESLAKIINQSNLKQAKISASLDVSPARVDEIEHFLEENGLSKVERTGNAAHELSLAEIAAASRENAARQRDENLRTVVSRQKDDTLSLYLSYKGAYVNGRSIAARDIEPIVKAADLSAAVISAEPYLSEGKIAVWRDTIRKAGINKVEITAPKPQ